MQHFSLIWISDCIFVARTWCIFKVRLILNENDAKKLRWLSCRLWKLTATLTIFSRILDLIANYKNFSLAPVTEFIVYTIGSNHTIPVFELNIRLQYIVWDPGTLLETNKKFSQIVGHTSIARLKFILEKCISFVEVNRYCLSLLKCYHIWTECIKQHSFVSRRLQQSAKNTANCSTRFFDIQY